MPRIYVEPLYVTVMHLIILYVAIILYYQARHPPFPLLNLFQVKHKIPMPKIYVGPPYVAVMHVV